MGVHTSQGVIWVKASFTWIEFLCRQISESLETDSCIFKKTVVNEVKGVMREQHTLMALNVDVLLISCPLNK